LCSGTGSELRFELKRDLEGIFQNDQEQSLAEVREDRRTQRRSEPFPISIKGEDLGWWFGKSLISIDANAMLITLSMAKLLIHRLRLQELLVFLFD
jgi:hypothetical protein